MTIMFGVLTIALPALYLAYTWNILGLYLAFAMPMLVQFLSNIWQGITYSRSWNEFTFNLVLVTNNYHKNKRTGSPCLSQILGETENRDMQNP